MAGNLRCRGTLAVLALALLGCGGGGGSSDSYDGFDASAVGWGGGSAPPLGATPPSEPLPPQLTFRLLSQSGASGILTAQQRVARNWTEFLALWNEHQSWWKPGIGAPIEGPPDVDFETEIVVAIFLGPRPTSGYAVEVLSVEAEDDGARVVYEEQQPGQNCVTVQVITYPFIFIAMTRVEGAILFDGAVRTVDCP